jgi:predicted RNase H-like HicB family nuclease
MKNEIEKYSFIVKWSEDDQTFIARCPEFPDLMTDGETPENAIEEMKTVLSMAVDVLEEKGREIPAPLLYQPGTYNGTITIRTSGTLHRNLAESAQVEGLSLNAYVCQMLAERDALRRVYRALVHPRGKAPRRDPWPLETKTALS